MKSEKPETLSKQVKAALRDSEESFRLVAAEPKRGSLIPQGKSRTTPYNSQQVG